MSDHSRRGTATYGVAAESAILLNPVTPRTPFTAATTSATAGVDGPLVLISFLLGLSFLCFALLVVPSLARAPRVLMQLRYQHGGGIGIVGVMLLLTALFDLALMQTGR